MENPGKSWKKKWSWKVMEKSWKIAKIQNFMEICLPGKVMKKSWKSVVQICLIMFLLCCDQCGSRLYSSVSLITVIKDTFPSWKSHEILFLNLCGNPVKNT